MNNKTPENNTKTAIGRKQFIGSVAALGVAAALGIPGRAEQAQSTSAPHGSGTENDNTGNFLIKGGYILTMDKAIGDFPKGDVHVQNGAIVKVGENIQVAVATEINADGMIVLPGLIETHWHVWTSFLRSMAGAKKDKGYFDITSAFGKYFTPEGMYISTRLALTEALYSGITYVHDWCHNTRSLAHAEASIRAIEKEGIRARFSVGLPAGSEQETPKVDMRIIQKLLANANRQSKENMVSIGLAWPSPGANPEERLAELADARRWKVPISVHAGRKEGGEDSIEKIKDMLGPDMQVIHGIKASDSDLAMLKEAGSSVSISPFSELRIGYGFPPLPQMLASGVHIGLSVDTFPLSGNADMFAVMKVFLNIANALSKDEFITTGRRILELATIEGARSMGIEDKVGSLTPGKRADIILVETQTPNMVPFIDPIMLLVTAAQPANVNTVMVDGKLLKRDGKLLKTDVPEIFRKSEALATRLKRQVGW